MGDSKYTPNPRKYYKTNFVDLVELITPEVYKTEDLSLSGTEVNPLSQVINSHLNVASRISNVIPLSGVANSQTSALGNISGISQYFVKQNELTKINPFLFESKILLPLSTTFANYDTSAEFATYLSGTLLPMIIPPSLTQVDPLQANMTTLSALTGDVNASSVHNHLVDTLGWMYFLNTSADGGLDYSPSSYVLSSLNSLYLGNTLETIDGIKGLTEYLWRNNETCSFGSYIPTDFVSGTADGITESSAGVIPTYTSGTQKLEALQTLVDVIYSPLYIDQQDYTVKSAFDNFIDASLSLTDRTAKGPFRKFTNLLGYEFADLTNEIDNIGLIYDIENVKDEHIQYIADLIGFRLRGNSPSKWRQQLRLALDLYKKSGTIDAIQAAINALIVDSVFDVSGKVDELWESYIPQLIWYALGTESPLFKDLNTWTFDLANQAGIYAYSTSSLDENLKIVTDSILLDLYKAFPDNFLFHGNKFSVPELWELDANGCTTKRYTVVNEPGMKPFHVHSVDSLGYQAYKQEAKQFDESKAFEAATGFGALGSGVYMAGAEHPTTGERPTYLKPQGDLNFLFSYREKENYPLPPFEEIKYYRDSTVTADLVSLLVARLKCFKVKESFADEVGNYILSSAVTDDSDLGTLNEFLMLFSSVQVPSNFDDVMLSISDYEKNLLDLWNGKSSHLFINFKDTDFDFAKTTLEGDGKYALYEAARVAREFSPAHAITRVNLTASAEDALSTSSAKWEYLGFDKDDTRAGYTSASVLGNFEISGAAMGAVGPGNFNGRGGLNTFKRADVDRITDSLESTILTTTDANYDPQDGTGMREGVPRRALRRRNFRYTLPKEGYYDRTGFNSPVNWDLEAQNPNLLSYTSAPMESPNIDQAAGAFLGNYWRGARLGSVSAIDEIGPFAGTSAIEVSSQESTDPADWGGYSYIYAQETSAITGGPYGVAGSPFREKVWRSSDTLTLSLYVKRPPTGLTPSSFDLNLFDPASPGLESNGVDFEYLGGGQVPTIKLESTNVTGTIEDVGNAWYRCSIACAGLGKLDGDTIEGDLESNFIIMGDIDGYVGHYEDLASTRLWIYGPQLEQWRTGYKTSPTAYQAVEGAVPTVIDRGENTLGYVPSAGEFYPILDPINPSGVWHECEKLDSSRQFSGVYTSATYPYRGLSSLGSNNKMPEVGSTTDRYVDRGQVPELYNTMHELLESKAYDYANEQINLTSSSYAADAYWKNNRQSFANEAIASGFVLNSFADYENFSFGTGLQKAHRDYCKYFAKHPLGLNEIDKTGGNIFAQVFGKGLYNCDFDLTGYAASTIGGNYIASSVRTNVVPISNTNGSGVFSTCAVAAYSDKTADLPASGTYIAEYPGQGVVPLSGTYTSVSANSSRDTSLNTCIYYEGAPYNAEFRNANILSGIEFVQTSGAPNANQFTVFKLDSSNAVPGMENFLINNSVIKCKSLGGLPRLRFDLSSYGDRPNQFIKDHKFKLNVKSLVAEENSPILGGGKLGVWIHTKAPYSQNKFMWTNYYRGAKNTGQAGNDGRARIRSNPAQLNGGGTGVQVDDRPPEFATKYWNYASGTSGIEMEFMTTDTRTHTFLGSNNLSAAIDPDKTTEWVASMYIKRDMTDGTSGVTFNFYDEDADPTAASNYWGWYFDANGVPQRYGNGSNDDYNMPGQNTAIESGEQYAGDGWWRLWGRLKSSDVDPSYTLAGDQMGFVWYMDKKGYHTNIQGKKMRFYGPQLEQYKQGTNMGPTPFKFVPEIVEPENPPGYMWSWTPNGKWEVTKEGDLSLPAVKKSLAHLYDFPVKTYPTEEEFCLGNTSDSSEVLNNNTLLNIKDSYFENFEIEFDTRNFTIHNNSEYLDIIPMENDVYEVTPQVNRDDTNYIVEVFFVPNNNPDKYLLIDSIELQDVTQRENTGIGTGHGVDTSGIPLRPFVTEDKLYLDKDQLRDVLKFYNGLAGLGTGMYATNLASRDATITSGTMEVSGGSRLNYRLSPTWGATNANNQQPNYYSFSSVEIDN